MSDDTLSRVEGLILLLGMIALVTWIGIQGRRESQDPEPLAAALEGEIPEPVPAWKATLWLSAGLVVLLVGSRALVWGAVGIARGVGVSELVIGLTLVALGTSLPEIAASIAAARRNEQDIAVGNVVGSNMFNLLGVLGLPGVIEPDAVVDHALVTRDFPIMVGVTLMLIATAVAKKHNHIGRRTGFVLVSLFVIYFVMLFIQPS
jgi:cation:H+ antiporter